MINCTSPFELADAIECRLAAAAVRAKAFRSELVPSEAKLDRAERRECVSAAQLLNRRQAEPARLSGKGNSDKVPRSRKARQETSP